MQMRLKNIGMLYAISAVVAFGGFVFGYEVVAISMMAHKILQAHPMQPTQFSVQLSVITTLLPIGALIGSILASFVIKMFGERKAMILLDILGIICCYLIGFQIQFWNLYLGRFLIGLYIGIYCGVSPAYLISISPPELAGFVGSFNQINIVTGIAFAYGFAKTDISWTSFMLFPCFLLAINWAVLYGFKFDTLQRHFRNGQKDKLQTYVQMFYENGSVQQLQKLRGLKITQKNQNSNNNQENLMNKITVFLTSNAPKPIVKLVIVFTAANQFSGINAIMYYTKQIFEHVTNGDSQAAQDYTFNLGVMQVIMTFLGGYLINHFGRRSLMILGQSVIVGALVIVFLLDNFSQNSEGLIALVVFVHIFGFSISQGPVLFVYMAQIMENLTLVIVSLWSFTIVVSMISQIMIKAYGIGNVFLIYGILSFLCTKYFYEHMVESKGLSRQELVKEIINTNNENTQNSIEIQLIQKNTK